MSIPSRLSRFRPHSVSVLPKTFPLLQRRSIHYVPDLPHNFSEHGVPGVFTPKAFNTAWTLYQTNLVENLNRLVAGTNYENHVPLDIALMTSRQSDLAATFNYASQAHNNHFFFQALSPHETDMPANFRNLISNTFASPEALKTELLTTAASMFGSGWVWLVLDQHKCLRIMCTYNAGTPCAGSHRIQSTDMNTKQSLGHKPSGTIKNNGIIPLLNINVWQHAWLEDFGVNGKEEYLATIWKAINWDLVYNRSGLQSNREKPLMHR
ncbi:Manganese/iron superoxide dismutase [Geopyxis carbonaria]|nr:Manganese/iron superoxide dismutase [Geopyxis carbonaria]